MKQIQIPWKLIISRYQKVLFNFPAFFFLPLSL
jgi:hypothetical protein